MKSEELIQDLIDRTKTNSKKAEAFKLLSIEQLNYRSAPDSWSILECFEHLNLYGKFYIPEIETKINKAKTTSQPNFKAGLLGNYFAKSMLPKEQLNKMKTFKDKNPIGSTLDKTTLDSFIAQQEQIIMLLNKARFIDLNKTKTAVSISKWIKLKLGDTFRVVVYHNERHLVQASQVAMI